MCLLLCHSVVLTGDMNELWLVEHNNTLSTNKHLAYLLDEAGKGVKRQEWLDAETGAAVNSSTVVEKDIVVNVTNFTHASSASTAHVVIEFNGTLNITTDEEEAFIVSIEDAISSLVGDVVVSVVVERDDEGLVVSVVVNVENDDAANQVVDAVNDMDKGEDCVGVLCKVKIAFLELGSSASSLFCGARALLLVFTVFWFVQQATA